MRSSLHKTLALLFILLSTNSVCIARSLPSAHKIGISSHWEGLNKTSKYARRANLGGGLPLEVLDDNFQRSESERQAELTHAENDTDSDESSSDDSDDDSSEDPNNARPWLDGFTNRQYQLGVLSDVEIEGLWNEALQGGTQLKATLDKYVATGENRAQAATPIQQNYETNVDAGVDLEGKVGQVKDFFAQAALESISGKVTDQISITSKVPRRNIPKDKQEPVLAYAVDGPTGAIIVQQAFASRDGNMPTNKLRSSELLFQSYEAHMASTQGSTARQLRVIMRHHIISQETNNLMTLAHMRGDNAIGSIPVNDKGNSLPPTAGHGFWTPDLNRRTTKGDIYLRLLNSPNIKTVMHMLTDHVEDLDNLSVEEIHTFPQVLARPGVLPNSVRWSHMVLVLGKPIKVGTVETS